MMQAVRILEGRTDFVIETRPDPVCRPGGVVVRISAALVAPYMAALPLGAWATPPRPFTPGQCAIGVVEQGNGLFAAGQMVYFDAFIGSRDATDPAENHGFLGCFGLGPAAMPMLRDWPDGSFAERLLAPANCFTALPDLAAPPEVLCRLGWLATALHGLEQGGFRAGDRVAVNGATGLLGAGAVVLALALGAAEVQIFGRNAARLADLVALDPTRVMLGQPETPRPCDRVLDCASGNDDGLLARLLGALRRFGTAVVIGGRGQPAFLDTAALMRKSQALIGSYWFTPPDLARLLHLIASGKIDLAVFRPHGFRIDGISAAIEHASTQAGGLDHTVLIP